MRVRADWSLLGIVIVLGACQPPAASTSLRDTVFVAGTKIGTPPPNTNEGEWSMPARDYANSRYSGLAQITPDNAKNLHVSWTFSTGVLRGHEGQPLVVGNTMYIVTPYPNVSYALDLTQPGFPLKWKYRPENAQAAVGVACCDVVNRGATYSDGKIVYNLLDGHTVAVDAATGTELWRVKMGDVNRGETITMAPIVVKGKVIVGSSGGEMGVRGWIAALDLATGKELWRAYNVGHDADMKVGPRFKPFYPQDRGANLGVSSWPGDSWKVGGAVVWGWISYDPELNLLYHGTSNPGPWNGNQRPGDNKWSAAIIARDPDTGEMIWAFQPTPHDIWDYDAVNENILVDLPIGNATRKVLVHFDRNGFAYTMDRATGEVLLAKPFVPMNWSSGVDLATGRPNVNVDKATAQGKNVKDICPSLEGGKNQQPAAFSPKTGLFYVPTINLCMDFEGREVTYIAGTPYIGGNAPEKGGPGGYKGEFMAWDAVQGRKIWGIKEPFPVWSGALATAGNVVYYGTLDGWFKAVDARNGTVLYQFKVGSGIVGAPMTYTGPDGKQYVAVYAGIGGDMGLLIAGDVAANLPFDVRERGTTLPDLARYTSWGGMLFRLFAMRVLMKIHKSLSVATAVLALGTVAYRLGSASQAPSQTPRSQLGTQPTYFIEHPDNVQPGLTLQSRLATLTNPYEGDKVRIGEGAKLFIAYNCLDCHGAEGSGAMGPSLQDNRWHFGGTAGEVFQSIYEGRPDGMPSWGRRISDGDIWRLVAYVRTLSNGHSVATENFTGKTIARSGH